MKTPLEIKEFAEHCKNIAVQLDQRQGIYDSLRLELNGNVYAVFDVCVDEYCIDITKYINSPMSVIHEESTRAFENLKRMREELERLQYERLKAKFEK